MLLRDVARVEFGPDERRGVAKLNGEGDVVGGIVLQRFGQNALDVIANVKNGGTISEPLSHAKVFPPMVAHMVGVGEETGALDTMLGKVADFYEDEVAAAVKALTSILEPAEIATPIGRF